MAAEPGGRARAAHVLGRFLEISLQTPDIRASVEFYERLGFTQCVTGDVWPHAYGVLTDGYLVLGLHQRRMASPAITFARPDIAAFVPELEARGVALDLRKIGDEVFNEIGFRDPSGQWVTVLEARTYSPGDRAREQSSLCGDFLAFSVPAADFPACGRFWESLGFVALEEQEAPYLHLPLTSDHLDLAFHRPRTLDRPALVFAAADMPERIGHLREQGLELAAELPRGLDAARNALLESPEGLPLLLLSADG